MLSSGLCQDVVEEIVHRLTWVPLQMFPGEVPECSSQSVTALSRCSHDQTFLIGAATD
jgi:hypothetical protein